VKYVSTSFNITLRGGRGVRNSTLVDRMDGVDERIFKVGGDEGLAGGCSRTGGI
jgi:hypothetical protein